MTGRQYLSQAHKRRARLINLKRREEEIRTEAEGLRAIVYDKDKVQTSVTNKFDNIMAELVEVQMQYANAIEECMRGIAVREKQIAEMPVQYAEILRLRYIETDEAGMPLSYTEISRRLKMRQASSARKREGRAIRAFEKRWEMGTHSHTDKL